MKLKKKVTPKKKPSSWKYKLPTAFAINQMLKDGAEKIGARLLPRVEELAVEAHTLRTSLEAAHGHMGIVTDKAVLFRRERDEAVKERDELKRELTEAKLKAAEATRRYEHLVRAKNPKVIAGDLKRELGEIIEGPFLRHAKKFRRVHNLPELVELDLIEKDLRDIHARLG